MPDEKIVLPEYASLGGKHGSLQVVDVDADAAYAAWLAELEVPDTEITQYWLEVAQQCFKMELQIAMRRFDFEIHIHDPGKRWAQRLYKKGRGAEAAAQGKEARGHFKRLRGFIPG